MIYVFDLNYLKIWKIENFLKVLPSVYSLIIVNIQKFIQKTFGDFIFYMFDLKHK